MAVQRRFVADAAHELRSPLTALSLQAERLAEADLSAQAQERLRALRQGIARGRQLLDQLLSLARAQSDVRPPPARVSVHEVYRRVLEDLMPLAQARQIDIGVEGAPDVAVWTSELDLFTLVRNLADNAIRYTPEGGRVDLIAEDTEGQVTLRVRDNGPGIPPTERDRVFDPFYRTPVQRRSAPGWGCPSCRPSPTGWARRSGWTGRSRRVRPAWRSASASPLRHARQVALSPAQRCLARPPSRGGAAGAPG
jgi:two-component system OmpR family sensor kinase